MVSNAVLKFSAMPIFGVVDSTTCLVSSPTISFIDSDEFRCTKSFNSTCGGVDGLVLGSSGGL